MYLNGKIISVFPYPHWFKHHELYSPPFRNFGIYSAVVWGNNVANRKLKFVSKRNNVPNFYLALVSIIKWFFYV
jgi:hypothetical protein